MNKVLIITIALFLSISLQAQNNLNPCSTTDGKSEWLIKYQANTLGHEKTDGPLYIALAIHVVGDEEGNGYFSRSKIAEALCTLNEDFEDSNIHFYTSTDYDYINNPDYYDHDYTNGAEMMNLYYTYDKIDCYIVGNPAGACGYSSYGNGVALAKGCLGVNSHTWAHEIGHYLSLPHTFIGWSGLESLYDYSLPAPTTIGGTTVERVDSSNCAYASDGFCDTPPDYLPFRWNCNSDGESSLLQHDPEGVAFRSDGTLIMSYSSGGQGGCRSRFSEEQIEAMRANVEGPQSQLLTDMTPPDELGAAALSLTYPIQSEVAANDDNSVTLVWEPVDNATQYVVQMNLFPSFNVVTFEAHTDVPELTVPNLDIGKKYYWRVRAYNAWSSCKPYSSRSDFIAGNVVGINELTDIKGVQIAPNPQSLGQDISISYHAEGHDPLIFTTFNMHGEQVSQATTKTVTGAQSFTLPSTHLRQGIYFLQIQSPKGFYYEKFIIQ